MIKRDLIKSFLGFGKRFLHKSENTQVVSKSSKNFRIVHENTYQSSLLLELLQRKRLCESG